MRSKLIALVLSLPLLWGAGWLHTQDSDVAAGREAFEEGRFDAAVHAFRRALDGEGELFRLHFNLGTALVQRSQSQERRDKRQRTLDLAIVSLRQAGATRDPVLRELVRYNLANALFLRGRIAESILSYRAVLLENAGHDDARNNLEVALLAQRAAEREAQGGGDPVPGVVRAEPGGAEVQEGLATSAGAAQSGVGTEAATQGQEVENPGGDAASGPDSSGAGDVSGATSPTGTPEEPQGGTDPKSTDPATSSTGERASESNLRESRLSVQKKLEALERRSAELRRGMILRRTTDRLRFPDKRGSAQ